MDSRTFVLAHSEARSRAIIAVSDAPAGYVVTVRPPARNGEQNALLHALLTDISSSIEWAGQKRSVETWKRLLTAAWLRARGESVEFLPAIDGHGVDIVFRRTSTLSKGECAELIDYIHAWMSEQEIEA